MWNKCRCTWELHLTFNFSTFGFGMNHDFVLFKTAISKCVWRLHFSTIDIARHDSSLAWRIPPTKSYNAVCVRFIAIEVHLFPRCVWKYPSQNIWLVKKSLSVVMNFERYQIGSSSINKFYGYHAWPHCFWSSSGMLGSEMWKRIKKFLILNRTDASGHIKWKNQQPNPSWLLYYSVTFTYIC